MQQPRVRRRTDAAGEGGYSTAAAPSSNAAGGSGRPPSTGKQQQQGNEGTTCLILGLLFMLLFAGLLAFSIYYMVTHTDNYNGAKDELAEVDGCNDALLEILATVSPSSSPTPSTTSTHSVTGTITKTTTPTQSQTPSQTPSRSFTSTLTLTATPTTTNSVTSSETPTNTPSVTPTTTKSLTATPTTTITVTPTNTPSASETSTETASSSNTPSNTPPVTSSKTGTPSPTSTLSATNTRTSSRTPSQTPTSTLTLSASVSSTQTPSNVVTPSNSPTNTPSQTPSISATSTLTLSASSSLSTTSTLTVSSTPTTTRSQSGTRTPTRTASPTTTGTSSSTASRSKTPTQTPSATGTPLATPTGFVCAASPSPATVVLAPYEGQTADAANIGVQKPGFRVSWCPGQSTSLSDSAVLTISDNCVPSHSVAYAPISLYSSCSVQRCTYQCGDFCFTPQCYDNSFCMVVQNGVLLSTETATITLENVDTAEISEGPPFNFVGFGGGALCNPSAKKRGAPDEEDDPMLSYDQVKVQPGLQVWLAGNASLTRSVSKGSFFEVEWSGFFPDYRLLDISVVQPGLGMHTMAALDAAFDHARIYCDSSYVENTAENYLLARARDPVTGGLTGVRAVSAPFVVLPRTGHKGS